MEDIEVVRILADLGLVVLLFSLGLEFGWEKIRQIGFTVIIIGTIEISIMMALGYEIGILMGWTFKEAIFLGAALCISSSAVLVKVLRDEGKLSHTFGRLIVGILVVEDFAAVILLSILSAIASMGVTSLMSVGWLVTKLILFSICALVIGGILAPRVVGYVSRYQSKEMTLITSLAFCFGLALIGHELGISEAAGAFLIGTVLSDSRESEEIIEIMIPIRNMFAALFFVSIGMLIDLSVVTQYFVPALIISLVFILGKIVADTMGTFLAGQDGRTAIKVGMGMPQLGEFSLAMIKVGVDRGAIGAFLYPVIGVVTGITSFLYPFIFRGAEGFANFLERRSPALLKEYIRNLVLWLSAFKDNSSILGEGGNQILQVSRMILINAGVIMICIATGTLVLQYSLEISHQLGITESLMGLILGCIVTVLCLPSSVGIWKEPRTLMDLLYQGMVKKLAPSSLRIREMKNLNFIIRESILIGMLVILGIWSLPFLSKLFLFGKLAAPLPILLLLGMFIILGSTAYKIHGVLESTFMRTFLGDENSKTPENKNPDS